MCVPVVDYKDYKIVYYKCLETDFDAIVQI